MLKNISVQLVVWALMIVPVLAQDGRPADASSADGNAIVTRIFPVEHARVQDLARVVSLFGGRVQPEPELGVIGWTGPESQLAAVESAIRSLDVAPVPEPNVELTVYFLKAARDGTMESALPTALEGVATQLRQVFGFDTFRLLETTAMRVREGSRGALNGVLPERLSGDREARYEFGFDLLEVTEDEDGRSVRLDNLRASVQAPTVVMEDGQPKVHWVANGIRTDIDFREGHKAVIGKTSVQGGPETIFVVVTGSIVE
jgi:hypothetical protein